MKIFVIIAFIAVTCHATSPLKQAVKLNQNSAESHIRGLLNQQESSKINGQAQVESATKNIGNGVIDKWLQANGFIYLQEPFSVSPYYDFLDAFLLGLKLDTYFQYSTDCINALVYSVDDYAYL